MKDESWVIIDTETSGLMPPICAVPYLVIIALTCLCLESVLGKEQSAKQA